MNAQVGIDKSEAGFEKLIVREMLASGWLGDDPDGGNPTDYANFDAELGLYPEDLINFIQATQTNMWDRLVKTTGSEEKARIEVARRFSDEIDKRGTIDVLRRGLTIRGDRLVAMYPKPELVGDPKAIERYEANRLRAIRQVRFDPKTSDSVDLTLTVNGIPTATCELKNRFTGQQYQHAIKQYREDRDPANTTLGRRAIVHFAVDSEEAHMTTKLAGQRTRFLPFNQGSGGPGQPGGQGNPPAKDGHPTSYLWREVFAPDAWIEILQDFVFEDAAPGKRGPIIFPRFHQWHVVRAASADARSNGAGQNYLVQHSAGSGKSKEIAWLAHELSSARDTKDEKLFTKAIVISDRRVLDQQLQNQVAAFEQVPGTVKKIEQDSNQLLEALKDSKTQVIITTLQKFPFVMEKLSGDENLKDGRYALIVDEAHSSQSGDTATSLKQVLGAKTIDDLDLDDEQKDGVPTEMLAVMAARGVQPNLSFFAFTATPKARTLELFGRRDSDGELHPFHTYSMRQAIEEGFIVDVLKNYTTYDQLFKLEDQAGKEIELPKGKARKRLAQFAKLHPSAKAQKAQIIVEHFREIVRPLLNGKAKAIIVTSSRQEAVRYKQAIDKYIREQKYDDVRSLVAFSGAVEIKDVDADDYGEEYTEPKMNAIDGKPLSEKALPGEFDKDEYGILVVAEKYQTGFDQPKLCAMYVDKPLSGVNAVQTLSRLNRSFAGKDDVYVLDFANSTEEIFDGFEPYYETTSALPTDPNVLFDLEQEILNSRVIDEAEVMDFAAAFYDDPNNHSALTTKTQGAYDRARQLSEEDLEELRGSLDGFVRAYSFLSQVIGYMPPRTEALYIFAKVLRDRLGRDFGGDQNVNLTGLVKLTHYRAETSETTAIDLGEGEPLPLTAFFGADGRGGLDPESVPKGLLSELVESFNNRYGDGITDADLIEPIIQITNKIATNNPGFGEEATANEFDDFSLGKDQEIIKAIVDVKGTNETLLKALLDDDVFRKRFSDLALLAIYNQARTSDAPDVSDSDPQEAGSDIG